MIMVGENTLDKIEQTERWVKDKLLNETTGHDWHHIVRVTNLAKEIAEREGANLFIVTMAALLHDVADDKIVNDETAALQEIVDWLQTIEVSDEAIDHIMEIIQTISFKGGTGTKVRTLEARVVQDADRLDALGAIGIARTFQYSGAKGQAIYDPTIQPRTNMTLAQYRNEKSSAINHFYEKLLLLKETMNTEEGKQIAEQRHRFMEQFLVQFFEEWGTKQE